MPASAEPSQVRMNIEELGSMTSSRSPGAPPEEASAAATRAAASWISA